MEGCPPKLFSHELDPKGQEGESQSEREGGKNEQFEPFVASRAPNPLFPLSALELTVNNYQHFEVPANLFSFCSVLLLFSQANTQGHSSKIYQQRGRGGKLIGHGRVLVLAWWVRDLLRWRLLLVPARAVRRVVAHVARLAVGSSGGGLLRGRSRGVISRSTLGSAGARVPVHGWRLGGGGRGVGRLVALGGR